MRAWDERAGIADNFPRLIEGCAKREVERGVGGLVEVDGREEVWWREVDEGVERWMVCGIVC